MIPFCSKYKIKDYPPATARFYRVVFTPIAFSQSFYLYKNIIDES